MGANFLALIMSLLGSFLSSLTPLFGSTFQGLFLVEGDAVGAPGVFDTPSALAELALLFIAMGIGYKLIGWVFGFLSKRFNTSIAKKKRARA